MVNNKKKSQAFSTDIVIVVVIILFGALFLVMNKINTIENSSISEQVYSDATKDSNVIVDNLKKKNIIDSENKVNADLLLSLDEAELKEELGITGDFAIVFEKDGKLVQIDSQKNINCIGSKSIIVNGQSCG